MTINQTVNRTCLYKHSGIPAFPPYASRSWHSLPLYADKYRPITKHNSETSARNAYGPIVNLICDMPVMHIHTCMSIARVYRYRGTPLTVLTCHRHVSTLATSPCYAWQGCGLPGGSQRYGIIYHYAIVYTCSIF